MSVDPWYKKNYKDMLKYNGRLLPLVNEQAMKASIERNSHRDTDHLHPSELSKKDWCPRSAWYKIMKYPAASESLSFSRLNVFEEGHSIHNKWQTWLWKAGVLSGDWYCESCNHRWSAVAPTTCAMCSSTRIVYREVPIHNDEHRILGHADGLVVDKSGEALIEIKSVGIGTVRFEKPGLYADYANGQLTIDEVWKMIKSPFASHIRQGNLYMHCTGVHTIIFLYEWKPTQEVKEFIVNYNEDIVNPILDNCKLVLNHLESGVTPSRPDWAAKTSAGCKYCPYIKECWK